MAGNNWIGRGKGRSLAQPSVPGVGGPGAGGGRSGSQSSVAGVGGPGAGGGRAGSQPTIETTGGPGRGQGRAGGQPSLKSTSDYGGLSSSGGDNPRYTTIDDPEGNYIFALEIDSVEIAHFLECSGMKSTTEVFEIQEGGVNDRVHKLPGQSKWENIQLRYGVTSDTSLLGWRNEILQDQFHNKYRNGSIVVKNNKMETVRRYNFKSAWPVAWEGPSLSASGSELAVEMLEIAHHGIEIT